WQSVHDDLFTKDERVCDMAELENAKKTVDKNERIIAYYKKKLKIISKLLGDRIMTILEGYEQRNILLGGGISSDTLTNIIDEEEEETVSDKAKKDNQGYTFGKM
ncbi:MAG: hypothetical protein PHP69_05810, partial [Candidatus Omnitrophica bacterium]|nr:hypothetical protein [Candidatus Omnitrophota bacterium]MDD5081255.1 hypothetical protein [Candidatus Omnitrophota bacterium]